MFCCATRFKWPPRDLFSRPGRADPAAPDPGLIDVRTSEKEGPHSGEASTLTADGVVLDPDWINIDTLRLWLQICDNQHGDKCKVSSTAVGFPQWLVDVDQLCVVRAKPGDRYVALSYVRGQVACLRTLRDNLEALQVPGSISDTKAIVPRTIQDSIRLTALLGEKWLWVDSLCIVQDDVESKHTQLEEMASIYANAYVTLIAANGWDANHGLRGIKGVTESRMLPPSGLKDIHESLQPYSTVWYSRGWTLQELIFSRRKIMFQYQMAIWECSCSNWHEASDIHEISPIVPPFLRCTPMEVKPNLDWPDLQQYMNLIRDYNDRHLTFPEDIIAGFSGVLRMLSSVFIGGFVYGLPEMFFDDALLWQPESPVQRRVPSSRASSQSLPSWSWAGWRGDINTDSWSSGYIRIRTDPTEKMLRNSSFRHLTRPVCQWSCGDGTAWRKIEIGHYKELHDRRRYIAKSKPLPPNWSLEIDDSDNSSFVHTSMPWWKFYYPVTIGAVENQAVGNSGHLLSCRTRRLQLYLGSRGGPESVCSLRRLLNVDGRCCGFIRLNEFSEDTEQDFRPLQWPMGTRCDLVAISEGSNSSPPDPMVDLHGDWPYLKEFYNVLWIEWVDGIAYRKALGKVAKNVWDSHPEEWIDVILG
jgi:hypothetical protein